MWVHNILICDLLSKPFELPIQEIEQKVLGKDIVILNMPFDGNLDALVRKSFDLDELGLKDQIRMTGLGFAKNPKWPENEWTPEKKLIDGKITLQFVSLGSKKGYYTCKIPLKGDGPDLVNNIN